MYRLWGGCQGRDPPPLLDPGLSSLVVQISWNVLILLDLRRFKTTCYWTSRVVVNLVIQLEWRESCYKIQNWVFRLEALKNCGQIALKSSLKTVMKQARVYCNVLANKVQTIFSSVSV